MKRPVTIGLQQTLKSMSALGIESFYALLLYCGMMLDLRLNVELVIKADDSISMGVAMAS